MSDDHLLTQAQAAAGALAFLAQVGHGLRPPHAVATLRQAQAIAAGRVSDPACIEATLDDLGAFVAATATLAQGGAVERVVANADAVRRQLRGVGR